MERRAFDKSGGRGYGRGVDGLLALLAGYLLGSVPFGVLLTKIFGAGDVRAIGSGNIGATNVLRTGHKGLAAATLLLDGIKGAVAVILLRELMPGWEALAGAGAVVGHCFPVWLRFRGGKGVATLLGVAAALSPIVGAVCAVAWIAGLVLGRASSVAGMGSAAAAPLAAWLIGERDHAVALAGLAVLVIWQHRENIARLRAGIEPKVGSRK